MAGYVNPFIALLRVSRLPFSSLCFGLFWSSSFLHLGNVHRMGALLQQYLILGIDFVDSFLYLSSMAYFMCNVPQMRSNFVTPSAMGHIFICAAVTSVFRISLVNFYPIVFKNVLPFAKHFLKLCDSFDSSVKSTLNKSSCICEKVNNDIKEQWEWDVYAAMVYFE